MYGFFMVLASLALLATLVGLVKPTIVRLKSRKVVLASGFGAVLVFAVIAGMVESDEHREERLAARAAEKAQRDSLAAVKAQEESIAAAQRARQDSIEFAALSEYEQTKVWAAAVLPEEDRFAAYGMAEKFVEQVLPTPDSVDFPFFNGYDDEHAAWVRASGDVWEYQGTLYREYHVHTTFSAQNRYGATIRYELNAWVYNSAEDSDNWRRFKMNIVDPSLKWSDPGFSVFEVDPVESKKPRRPKMPTGWSPASQ